MRETCGRAQISEDRQSRRLLALTTAIYPKQEDDRKAYSGSSSASLGFKFKFVSVSSKSTRSWVLISISELVVVQQTQTILVQIVATGLIT